MSSINESNNTVLELKNVNVVFHENNTPLSSLKDIFVHIFNSKNLIYSSPMLIHALKGINIKVKNGDLIGILGRNGAGKSSLCTLISGFIIPDTGEVLTNLKVRSISSNLNLLYPDLSGEDNAKLILRLIYPSLSQNEIQKLSEEAFEFAEITKFKELSAKNYSKGMMARLVLSIITSGPCDFLIIDELFDGADQFFMDKFRPRLDQIIKNAKAAIFISHNIDVILAHCNRAIVMEEGQVKFDGSPQKALYYYQNKDWINSSA
jgi:ABC-type polysaccharide/polyol phosphate transport system ATPase subunit